MSRYMQTVVKDETHKALKVLASQSDKTLGELVETAIEEYIEKENPQGGQIKGSVTGQS